MPRIFIARNDVGVIVTAETREGIDETKHEAIEIVEFAMSGFYKSKSAFLAELMVHMPPSIKRGADTDKSS